MKTTQRNYILAVAIGVILSSILHLGLTTLLHKEAKCNIAKINSKEITKFITTKIIKQDLKGAQANQYTDQYIEKLNRILSTHAIKTSSTIIDSKYILYGAKDITAFALNEANNAQ